jgi:predicted NAD-dependent protein-ADP-ribosyltransferase YbiA (DUF1768 family)
MPLIQCEATCTSKTKGGPSRCSLGAKYFFPEGVGYRCLTHAKKLTEELVQYKMDSRGNTNQSSSPTMSSSPVSSDFSAKRVRKNAKREESENSFYEPNIPVEIHEISSGKYEAFSNFYICPFEFKGIMWSSAENAYQGMRFYWNADVIGGTQRNVDVIGGTQRNVDVIGGTQRSADDEDAQGVKNTKHKNEALMNVIRALMSVPPIKAREIGNRNADNTGLERVDWNTRGVGKFSVGERFMFEILITKFSNPRLQELLLSTGKGNIVIHSTEKEGMREKMGEILMAVREHFRIEQMRGELA